MNFKKYIESVMHERHYREQVVHVHTLEPREAFYKKPDPPLNEKVENVLRKTGIDRLYTHQVDAINAVGRGENVVIVTSTASGKTYCYVIPILEDLIKRPDDRMLLIYPTKALAQDQLRRFNQINDKENDFTYFAGTYDGDTPTDLRRKLRDNGNLILTNPDMLHQGILPNHSKWAQFFSRLKYVVTDEIHMYRGVFGSNMSNLYKRLQRICSFYGSNPQFINLSATIANPKELTEKLINRPVTVIKNDGSPKGRKYFVLWNPPLIDIEGAERRSSLSEAQYLMSDLIQNRVQTITFTRTRLSAEIIRRYCEDSLKKYGKGLANSIKTYRGGYLPEERREIEQRLASGDLTGVVSTNALELGIDIGSLDAAIIVGYPGSIASTLQEAGRAGRGTDDSLAVLVGQNNPIDQFLLKNPDALFGKSPEQAVIDPENPHIAVGHLKCALYELPMTADERNLFGEYTEGMLQLLEDEGEVKKGTKYWKLANKEYPAKDVNLRNAGTVIYTIMDETAGNKVIGTVDEEGAFLQLYTHAVYLHDGFTYFVNKLDTEQKIAWVEKQDVDYYTQSVSENSIKIDFAEEKKLWNTTEICLGEITVTTIVIMFKKVKFYTKDSLGFEGLTLPEIVFDTAAFWLMPPKSSFAKAAKYGRSVIDGLVGISNLFNAILPIHVMCDASDVGGAVDSASTGAPTLFIYDRFQGGVGFAERGYMLINELMDGALDLVKNCTCKTGCLSCTGAAEAPFAKTDMSNWTKGRIPDKETALILLHDMLGLEEYIPKFPKPEIKIEPFREEESAENIKPVEFKRLPPNMERKLRKRIRGDTNPATGGKE